MKTISPIKLSTYFLAWALSASFLLTSAQAATLEDITMPDKMELRGEKLVLNGLGVRKATWFKVRVYVAGLYLGEKSSVEAKVLDQPGMKYLRMKFLRNVGRNKLVGAWEDAFKRTLKDQNKFLKERKLLREWMKDIKETEEMIFVFAPNEVEIKMSGKSLGTIQGKEFSKALLALWFINAEDEGLKKGLLGLS